MPYKDPERKRANHAAYHAEHRAEILPKLRAYNAAHSFERRAYDKAHRPEKRVADGVYREAHRAVRRAYQREYRKQHPEELRVANALFSARKLGLPATLTVDEWREVLERYGYRCAYCGAPYEQMDHVVPLSAGGPTTSGNVVPACHPCNKAKGVKTVV